MNCSVCNRKFVVNLSVCPACGTMMDDSVREELILKRTPVIKKDSIQNPPKPSAVEKPLLKPPPKIFQNNSVPRIERKIPAETLMENPVIKKKQTVQLDVKPTSPTLMEFQSKEAVLPEWRLELKNAVQKRLRNEVQTREDAELFPAPRILNRTMGATALKPEYIEETVVESVLHENPKVQAALLRIEQSRKKFFVENETVADVQVVEPESTKDFPFYIASRSNEISAPKTEIKSTILTTAKPKLVPSFPVENFKRDTNKLPPLPKPAKIATSFDRSTDIGVKEEIKPIEIRTEEKPILDEIKISPQKTDDFIEEQEEVIVSEIEDIAPFSMRFNAGLFDLIIGGFTSLILLAPFVLLGGNWFTSAGLLAFLATCSIVMFIYMTTAIGLFGKTFGMRMFALEIIDIEENDYPTFHQAAVNSAVYLLSLALGGSGFLTVLFTDDRRAVHDIVSGTLMVKDCVDEKE